MELSIVIPVYNEEENVEPLIGEIEGVLSALGKSYEIVVVDDGSRDGTFLKLRQIHQRLPSAQGHCVSSATSARPRRWRPDWPTRREMS